MVTANALISMNESLRWALQWCNVVSQKTDRCALLVDTVSGVGSHGAASHPAYLCLVLLPLL